jgi:peptidoglycan/LPS O-acetylase OafA/YrhL
MDRIMTPQLGHQSAAETPSLRPKRARLVELDLLRLVAAVSVVLFHYQPKLSSDFAFAGTPWIATLSRYGYLGVDLFFLLSGYVIVMSASGRTARSFLMHRALRLYPSFWIALILTVAAVMAFAPVNERPSAAMIAGNATMLPGYLGVKRIDDVYWTLAIEWKFYALVAVALAAGLGTRFLAVAATWLALLTIQTLGVDFSPLKSLTIFPYGSYFASGMVLYAIHENGAKGKYLLLLLLGWALSLSTASGVFPGFIHAQEPRDLGIVLSVVTGIFLVFLFSVVRRDQMAATTLWRVAGAVTFPLYLLHSRIGQLLIATWRPVANPTASLLLSIGIVVGVALLMAWFVELRLVPAIGRSRVIAFASGDGPHRP